MSKIDAYDEGKLSVEGLRNHAIGLETELIEIAKALDEFRGHQETNIRVIRRLRKFYTHDKERYRAKLAGLFAMVTELRDGFHKYGEDFDAACNDILYPVGGANEEKSID